MSAENSHIDNGEQSFGLDDEAFWREHSEGFSTLEGGVSALREVCHKASPALKKKRDNRRQTKTRTATRHDYESRV